MGDPPTTILRRAATRASSSKRIWVNRKRFALIASRFNEPISQALVRGATDVLRRHGVDARNISLYWVPGAFELPVIAAQLASARPHPHAIIALGALIQGQTPQYEILAQAMAYGLTQVAVTTRVPVTCGVIVATTMAQATARAGGSSGNRGAEAALAALELAHLIETL